MESDQLKAWLNEQLDKSGHGSKKMLAKHLGISPSNLSNMLNNSAKNKPVKPRSIRADELIKIIDFFGEIPPFLIKESEQFIRLYYQAKPEVQKAVLTILQNSCSLDKE
ncbi:XRE family transcriptional regulator [Bartonella gabonensis]|uniref:XRE family transcriptional regulator n=1 Tax=Bartonella gabonensis TaxID=2699889 RepID=UPI0015897EE1|nr:XRE family transcriptional regulator [Bartonella gabonensis]